MLTMIKTDFITMRRYMAQTLGICILIAIFIAIGTGRPIAGIAAVSAMLPFMYVFTIASYDEINGWERFRLTLPLSRRQIVLGRYASVLIIVLAADVLLMALTAVLVLPLSAVPQAVEASPFLAAYDPVSEAGHILMISGVIMVAAACSMPLLLRFGLTKGTRIVPMILVLIMVGGLLLVGNFEEQIIGAMPFLETMFTPGEEGAMLSLGAGIVVFVTMLVLYALSALIAMKLYEGRQF